YPYDSWEFLGNSFIACISMLAGYLAFEPSERRRAHRPLFFLLFTTALMIMTARWRRIVEYWPPFAVLFAAFTLQPWLEGLRAYPRRLPPEILEELQPFLDRETTPAENGESIRELIPTIAALFVALILCAFLFVNLRTTVREIKQSEPHEHYRAGAEWLRNHMQPGQVFFNTDWDDFP